MAISAAELPAMSRAVGTDAEIAAYLRSRLDAGLERIAFFIVPSAIALFALGDLIGYLLLQSGVWHKSDTIWVWQILAGSAIGLLASGTVKVKPLISRVASLAEHEAAFADARHALKVLLLP